MILRKLNILFKYKAYAGKREKIYINTFQCTLKPFKTTFHSQIGNKILAPRFRSYQMDVVILQALYLANGAWVNPQISIQQKLLEK
jgi:hypothetical protein